MWVCVRWVNPVAQAVYPQGQRTQIPLQQTSRNTICAHLSQSQAVQKVCVHYIEMQTVLLPPYSSVPTDTPRCNFKQDRVILFDCFPHTLHWLACKGVMGYWIITLLFNFGCYTRQRQVQNTFGLHKFPWLCLKYDSETAFPVFLLILSVLSAFDMVIILQNIFR